MPTHEAIAAAVAPVIRDLVEREVARRVPPKTAAQVAAEAATAAIMKASLSVGLATDELLRARFAGVGEIAARKAVLAANERLLRLMKKHGRLR